MIKREVSANEGHAHIYINGKNNAGLRELASLAISTVFLRENALTFTLIAYDHSTWVTPTGDLIAFTTPVIRPEARG
ncbi:hypothetical protein [Neptunicoccus cionae]|uniref:Uncharacterized protein n=1 Tax=Neptunicoccus cionae TaxID=2035344 RepID=A0A916R289_9RHOB|nr:hypothetical protein [Amylibacter cionae]GGA27556.1 hypothetical protein GCM10011498_30810 [Amylibacter cionae]